MAVRHDGPACALHRGFAEEGALPVTGRAHDRVYGRLGGEALAREVRVQESNVVPGWA